MKWDHAQCVMIITKPGDCSLIRMTREMALYLIETPRYGSDTGITVYVDEKLRESNRFNLPKILQKHPLASQKLKFWTPEICILKPKSFDFIITVSLSILSKKKLDLTKIIARWGWYCIILILVIPKLYPTCDSISFRFSWFFNSI